ncbi:MAG: aspartate aminotransferase family protein [Hyphomicrobiales bacterium]|nr:aspartate aminotransferase family protein [Hyphomicrobiales bacterium]
MVAALLPTYARADLRFVRGEGPRLFTENGEVYLDCTAGIAVNALGHAHPHLVNALKDQAEKLWHTSNLFRIPDQERFAERLVARTFADRVFMTNSGAEAIECALKMARKHHAVSGRPERYRFVTFEGAFHGRTLATIAAGGQSKYLEGFGPPMEGFDQVPFGDHDRVQAAIGPETAAILIEPIQGEGGIRPVPREGLRGLRELADEHGLLLILDEIQCGVGRTGHLFAHEAAGIEPDIMAIAKGIGGGFPVGACLATENAAKGMTAGTHGTTFGGNPLAMAVGNAVLDVVLEEGFLQRVRDAARHARQKLARLVDEHPLVLKGIRGEGLMLALECVVPNAEFIAAARDARLLLVPAGDNVVRFLPPLTISDEDLDLAVEKLSAACGELEDAMAGTTPEAVK